MPSNKSMMEKVRDTLRTPPAPLPSRGSRDRSLHGKARIKARKATRREEAR